MKKRNLKSLKLTKESISKLDHNAINGGLVPVRASTQGGCGSQHDSRCGYSCDPALC
ncbi:MAG: hypothetical protein AAF617_05830 [Bacteroidota bacterium]